MTEFNEPEDPCQEESEPDVARIGDYHYVPGNLVTQAMGADALARYTPDLSFPQRSLLLYIYSETGRRGRAYRYISKGEMAKAFGSHRGAVQRYRDQLEELGWIHVEESLGKPFKCRIWFNSQMLFELMESIGESGMPLGKKYVKKLVQVDSQRVTSEPEVDSQRVTYKDREIQREENRERNIGEPAPPAASSTGDELVQKHSRMREERVQKKLAGKPVGAAHVVEWWRSSWNESRFGKFSPIHGQLPPKHRGQLKHLLGQWRRKPAELEQFIQWVVFDWAEVLGHLYWLKERPDAPSPGWVLAMSTHLMEAWDRKRRPEVAKEMAERGENVAEVLGWDRERRKAAKVDKKDWRWRGTQSLFEDDDDYEF